MQQYLSLFFGIIVLKNAPQDLPASRVLFWLSLMLLFGMGFLQGAFMFPVLKNLAFNAFDLTLLLLFLHFLLSFNGHLPRFMQTVTAVCGVIFAFRVLELPGFLILISERFDKNDPVVSLSVLFLLSLLMCSVFVLGHILKHALSVSMLKGVVFAFSYYLANFGIMLTVFPR